MSGSFRENRVGWMCILARSVRTFPEEEKLKDRTDGVLADVELDKGKIRKLSLKEI